MAGPNEFAVRRPAVAGMFYPADPARCRAEARLLLQPASPRPALPPPARPLLGAIVPHAGWVCSGALAGEAIAALAAARPDADVVVVFAAIHTPLAVDVAVFDSHDVWSEPGATSRVAGMLRKDLAGSSRMFAIDDRFHNREHAVEVELPLIQSAWPDAVILPVEVPVIDDAMEIGRLTARAVIAAGMKPVYLASSDLTHYGPAYRFAPAGVGAGGLEWAKENDRRLLQVVTDMTPERVVPEVRARLNACGPGAIAAMMAACLDHGASVAEVLRHVNSFEVLTSIAPQPPDNSVGYAAVVVG